MTIVVRREAEGEDAACDADRTKLTDRFGNDHEIGLLSTARPASVRTSPDPQ
jgi:hypothetical protein